jgi:hypothetical protein
VSYTCQQLITGYGGKTVTRGRLVLSLEFLGISRLDCCLEVIVQFHI